MILQASPQKPSTVLYAEWALWLWTTWTCLFGMYQTGTELPQQVQSLNEQLQGLATIEPKTMMQLAIVGYAVTGISLAWAIYEIGRRKHWPRSSLLWGFAIELVWMLFFPPHGLKEWLTDIPDIALQVIAIYWLYTSPAKEWFQV